ncbi:uncharacterized protein H6S33_002443 [Morchella sextelata]|jgi:hypothetical protein|uniref:uncharacterized protein n=1 Tax=Morchella sextelata TaxID=1174677 RepID=UPI001D03ADB5|nr:uncharacterized protein H6S33_002443 [Morchella sextelata]KAH0607409.1 hypothetical protein H6S33_002443 [Morchella sextelata]
MASPAVSPAGSDTSSSRASSSAGSSVGFSLPPRYRPVALQQRPPGNNPSSTKSTSFYYDGNRQVCFVDFSTGASSSSASASAASSVVSGTTTTVLPTENNVRQPLPARPRYTAEEEAWIIKYANENPEKTWQHITDGFNIAFNQKRTLKGMQIKGYSLFEAKGKNGSLGMPAGLRQLRKKDEVEEDNDEDQDDDEDDEDDDDDESEQSEQSGNNQAASVGKRYTRAQEEWLLAYVANTAKTGRRKDWVSTAAAFTAKFGLERAPMSLNNKWTHLSRQSSASFQGKNEQEADDQTRGHLHSREQDKMQYLQYQEHKMEGGGNGAGQLM